MLEKRIVNVDDNRYLKGHSNKNIRITFNVDSLAGFLKHEKVVVNFKIF